MYSWHHDIALHEKHQVFGLLCFPVADPHAHACVCQGDMCSDISC